MPMTHTETIGFCSQVAEFLQENAATFQTKGADVTNWVTDVTNKKDSAITKNNEQDDLRARLKTKTGEAQIAVDDAYKAASTWLDAAIGILGKTTPLTKEAAKLRSTVNRKPKKDKPST